MAAPAGTYGLEALRRTVGIVAALNFTYFLVEAWIAARIGSVALFADSVDFLEDTSINVLVLLALGAAAHVRRRTGLVLAAFLLVPGIAALWTAWSKIGAPLIPDPVLLTATGAGALAVNAACALLLARIRGRGGSLTRAAFLSARNDVAANAGIIGAGLLTYATHSIWPDIVVGLAIAALNFGSAREVYEEALKEEDTVSGARP